MKPSNFIRNCRFYIWKEKFAIVKAKRTCPDAFANIIDKNEITLVIEQGKVNEKEVIDIEKDWKILTFDMALPFVLVGFLATVSKALADERISIYVISAYSTDHILIKEKDIVKAKKKLKKLGCKVVKEKVSITHNKIMLK
jgi:hypothetical protein